MMKYLAVVAITFSLFFPAVKADHHTKILYKDAVVPVLAGKCGGFGASGPDAAAREGSASNP